MREKKETNTEITKSGAPRTLRNIDPFLWKPEKELSKFSSL
jgi:hypothetical protein